MQRSTVLLVAALVAMASLAQADKKKELMPRYIKYALECAKELNAEVGVCKEMMKEGNDNSAEKYQPCKCVIACVAKKAKVMTDGGDANVDAFTAAVDEFEIKEWSDEWQRVKPLCEPEVKGKKDCVLGYDFFTCGYEKSEIFRDVIKKFMGAMDKS
nr:OBP3 [Frankliniella intonsa]